MTWWYQVLNIPDFEPNPASDETGCQTHIKGYWLKPSHFILLFCDLFNVSIIAGHQKIAQ